MMVAAAMPDNWFACPYEDSGELATLIRACRLIAAGLAPFLPGTAARIGRPCTASADGRLPSPSPVFTRLAQGTVMAAAVIECYAR